MKFAAFGRTQLLYNSILNAHNKGHKVVLIGTCQASPEYTVNENDFLKLAEQLNCPYFCDPSINQSRYIEMINESGAEVAISMNWLTLIGQEMLNQFKYGIINAHAGDLPRYRGNACPNWAILMGEEKIVITLHQMTTDLDAGAILLQRKFSLTSQTYIADVYKFLTDNIPQMYTEVLDGLENNSILPREQAKDPALSLRCFPRLPKDGEIDWHKSAEELTKLVRASSEPFAGAYSFLNTEKIIIWRAHWEILSYPYVGVPGQVIEIRKQSGEVAILTEQGVLILEEIETESQERVKAAAYIKSTRLRFGIDVNQEIIRLKQLIVQLQSELKK